MWFGYRIIVICLGASGVIFWLAPQFGRALSQLGFEVFSLTILFVVINYILSSRDRPRQRRIRNLVKCQLANIVAVKIIQNRNAVFEVSKTKNRTILHDARKLLNSKCVSENFVSDEFYEKPKGVKLYIPFHEMRLPTLPRLNFKTYELYCNHRILNIVSHLKDFLFLISHEDEFPNLYQILLNIEYELEREIKYAATLELNGAYLRKRHDYLEIFTDILDLPFCDDIFEIKFDGKRNIGSILASEKFHAIDGELITVESPTSNAGSYDGLRPEII